MILGAMGMFLINSYNVHASGVNIYKCMYTTTKLLEMHKIDINQSADTKNNYRDFMPALVNLRYAT